MVSHSSCTSILISLYGHDFLIGTAQLASDQHVNSPFGSSVMPTIATYWLNVNSSRNDGNVPYSCIFDIYCILASRVQRSKNSWFYSICPIKVMMPEWFLPAANEIFSLFVRKGVDSRVILFTDYRRFHNHFLMKLLNSLIPFKPG